MLEVGAETLKQAALHFHLREDSKEDGTLSCSCVLAVVSVRIDKED